VEDLRTPLRLEDQNLVTETLKEVYTLLRPCHTRFQRLHFEARSLGEEYYWYLRRFVLVDGDNSVWGSEWFDVWGDASDRYIHGKELAGVNPLWVLEKLRALEYPIAIGAIHGDLHPGNVVFTRKNRPVLIDFGWAQGSAHIAKDYVLMECNLRFLTLRTQVSDEELDCFVKWVGWDEPVPARFGEYFTSRAQLIQTLRECARTVFPLDTDWTKEYLVPLYFVAFGLLRFAPQLGNQRAAIRLVEALASYLSQGLKL
jgi:hypothetical protein